VQERPSVYASEATVERNYAKWKSFDADAALLELDNEDTTTEGKSMRLNADQGSAFLTADGYTKDREEYDLDQDIEQSMGNLKKILAQNFKDAAVLKQEGNELLRAGEAVGAIKKYQSGLATLQLASQAAVLMTTSLADKQSKLVADLHRNLAAAHLAVSDFEAALTSADEALQVDGSDDKARYRRALALVRLQRFEDASLEVRRLEDARDGGSDPAVQKLKEDISASKKV